jgi:hypothetical protein
MSRNDIFAHPGIVESIAQYKSKKIALSLKIISLFKVSEF